MTKPVRIVLVEPSHPGNIGAAARAMKTMGFNRLVLVNPARFPDDEALARAGKASDILENAHICADLKGALVNCGLVFGTSSRDRSLNWPAMSPEAAAEKASQALVHTEVAFVFGRERTGLTNEELQQCQIQINIPTNPEYPSLNLASAVQIVTYEAHKKLAIKHNSSASNGLDFATSEQLEAYYQHLEAVLVETEFLDPKQPKHLMARLRRLYAKSNLEQQELNILRGFLNAIQKKITL
jgi:tRNA (cytidine32/uridine32-2'-O)-methyltransferase